MNDVDLLQDFFDQYESIESACDAIDLVFQFAENTSKHLVDFEYEEYRDELGYGEYGEDSMHYQYVCCHSVNFKTRGGSSGVGFRFLVCNPGDYYSGGKDDDRCHMEIVHSNKAWKLSFMKNVVTDKDLIDSTIYRFTKALNKHNDKLREEV